MPPSATYVMPPPSPNAETVPVQATALSSSIRPSVSWQAVFAGLVIALAVELMLAILGVAVGLAVVNPGGPSPSGSSFGLAAGVWWIVSSIIALLFASYAAARLANVPARLDGLLQGLTIWGLSVVVALWVLSAVASGLVSGVVSALGGTLSSLSHGIEASAPQIASAFGTQPGQLQSEAQTLLQQQNAGPAQMSREQAERAIVQELPNLAAGGDRAAQAKIRIVAIVAGQLNISADEATRRVDQLQTELAKAKTQAAQTATNVAGKSAGTASDAAFAIFVALIVTAIASAVGGALARPRRMLMADRLR